MTLRERGIWTAGHHSGFVSGLRAGCACAALAAALVAAALALCALAVKTM